MELTKVYSKHGNWVWTSRGRRDGILNKSTGEFEYTVRPDDVKRVLATEGFYLQSKAVPIEEEKVEHPVETLSQAGNKGKVKK